MPADFLAIPYKETGFLNISDAIDRYLKSNVSKAVRLLRDMICILRPPPPPLSKHAPLDVHVRPSEPAHHERRLVADRPPGTPLAS